MINPEEKRNDLEQKINHIKELEKRLKESTEEDEKQNLKEEIKKTLIAAEQDCGLALAKLAKQKEIIEAEVYEEFASIKGKEETEELWRSKDWNAKRVLMSELEEEGFTPEEIIKLNSNLLPNAENAVVDIRKLRDYSLNPNHPTGKDKARLFSSILGMTAENAEELRQIILEQVKIQEACLNKSDQHGQRYYVDFTLTRENKNANIRSCWIIDPGSDFPRLTSCYIKL
ncbi:MAG: hypothetical protein RLZZ507_2930 [Cyanobacteriota bacterium]|jgi:hypothetical protein